MRVRGRKTTSADLKDHRRTEKGKQLTGRKGKYKTRVRGREKRKRSEEKFLCGTRQMRKTERVNDWAEGCEEGRKPVVFLTPLPQNPPDFFGHVH